MGRNFNRWHHSHFLGAGMRRTARYGSGQVKRRDTGNIVSERAADAGILASLHMSMAVRLVVERKLHY